MTWERAKKANIGLDLKMFDNQLSFTGDYFWEKRDNILWDYGTVPSIVGTTLSAANLGRVDNKGFELELGWNSKVRNFEYWISGVFSYAKNKIVYMDEAKQAYPYLAQTGYSVGQYKGYINEGFINTDADLENQPAHGWGGDRWAKGELNFIDINGDGIVDTNDRVTIGYGSYPEITFGVNLGFQWKGFEVSALLQGAAKRLALPETERRLPAVLHPERPEMAHGPLDRRAVSRRREDHLSAHSVRQHLVSLVPRPKSALYVLALRRFLPAPAQPGNRLHTEIENAQKLGHFLHPALCQRHQPVHNHRHG